ncbi:MAG: efflux RND transporter periplasmic adaptor subunit [Candidatus Latescibacterota bacterium]
MIRITALLLSLSLVFLPGCSKKAEKSFSGSGIIEATEVIVSAQARGELLSVDLQEGDHVKKGQILASIDVKDLKLQREATAASLDELEWNGKTIEQDIAQAAEAVRQASLSLDNLKITRDRIANLYAENAATKDRLDKAETEYSLGQSRLEAAKKQLAGIKTRLSTLGATRKKTTDTLKVLDNQIGKERVLSPLEGLVITKSAETGEVVNFGSPVCTIADMSDVWLMIYVGENMLGKIKVGGKARVRIDSNPDRSFEGAVTWVSPKAEFTPKNVQTRESRVDLVYAVKITMPNPEGIFKIGMPAEAYIEGL